MQFLTLRNIYNFCDFKQSVITKESLKLVKDCILKKTKENPNQKLQTKRHQFSLTDLSLILNEINDEKIIFHDWIATNTQLRQLLENAEFTSAYIEDKRLSDHFLQRNFKLFVSRYLHSILTKKINDCLNKQDLKELNIAYSYTVLIDKSKKDQIDLSINQYLRDKTKTIKEDIKEEISKAISVDTLNKAALQIINPDFIALFNTQEKAYYSTSLALTETATDLLNHKYFTKQLATTLFNGLKKLQLNPEHKEQLNQLSKAVRANKIKKLKNTSTLSQSKLSWSKSHTILSIFLLLVTLIIYFVVTDVKKATPNLATQSNGFDSLNIEEMKQLDAVLKDDGDSILIAEEINASNLQKVSTPIFVAAVSALKLLNPVIEQLHKDLLTDYALQNALYYKQVNYTTCNEIKRTAYPTFQMQGIEDFPKQNTLQHSFENNSNYDIYLIGFENKANGKSYGKFLPRGSSITLNISKNLNFLFYAGNSMTKFSPVRDENHGYGNLTDAQKVSALFNAHFCFQDPNTNVLLNNFYELTNSNAQTTTISNAYSQRLVIKSDLIKQVK